MRKFNVKGFSLVELMVVVAIIGILSAIAIPNFQRFQRKARQAEVKALLGGLYTAMETFKAEWEDYYGDWQDIGYAPSGNLRYNVGFAAMGGNPLDMSFVSIGMGAIEAMAGCGAVMTCMDNSGLGVPGGTTWTNAAGLGADTFTAGGQGNIGGTMTDQWTVDYQKVWVPVQDGTI